MWRKVKEGAGKRKHVCSTCECSLRNERYAKCDECPYFKQCLSCLSVGLESENHNFTHRFYIVDPSEESVYRTNWTREEEIQLLYAVKALGLGNWSKISEVIGTKSTEEVEVHYVTDFIQSDTAPFPNDGLKQELPLPPPPPFDTMPRESDPLRKRDKAVKDKSQSQTDTYGEQCNWMPFRHEFDQEFEMDAESLVAHVTFGGRDDTPETFEQKIKQLLSYNQI